MSRKILAGLLMATCLGAPLPLQAHHSFAEYDQAHPIELQGKLTAFRWENPHVHFTLQTTERNGSLKSWEIESNSVSILRRTNATPENVKVGQIVRMAGWPSRRADDRLFVTNLQQQNGQELILDTRAKPRWGKSVLGLQTTWVGGAAPVTSGSAFFHVWASDLGRFETVFPWLEPSQYPLTEKAKRALAKWDPIRDSIARGCEPKGMPTIMEQPYPIEFIDKKDTILLRMEEYDTVRTIHMKPDPAAASRPQSLLGYSTGRWQGSTLVVETRGVSWRFFDPSGLPQGRAVSIVERFTPSPDGSRLSYTFKVTDPETFTQPVELKRSWIRRPGEAVKPYNCKVEKTRASR